MSTAASKRLRVTLVVGVFPALSETFVLDQVVYLLERGHDVRIVAYEARREAGMHDEVLRHGLLDRVRYLAKPVSWSAKLRLLGAAFRAAGFGFIGTALALGCAKIRDGETGNFTKLAALILAFDGTERPDVFLCHFGQNGSLALRAVEALGWPVPVATIFHGFDLTMLVKHAGPRVYRHLLTNGQMFLPVCASFKKTLEGMGALPANVFVQRMGVDAAGSGDVPLEVRAGDDGLVETFTFLAVGRLVEKKGQAGMLRAFARVFRAAPDGQVSLRIVGDGPLDAELRALAKSEAISVTFLGALRREDVSRELRNADVFLQPSVTALNGDTEGAPVSIMEAMALSKPVIATRHSGIPELVLDGVTGVLVDERDDVSLGDAMVWMRDNAAAARKMGDAGRARLVDGFQARQWNDALEGRLMELADRR